MMTSLTRGVLAKNEDLKVSALIPDELILSDLACPVSELLGGNDADGSGERFY
jgi:hypothetical protein